MKYLIMHGSYGSPSENWFPWLKKELELRRHEVILEQFPVDNWDAVEKIGPEKIGEYQAVQSVASWEAYFVEHILPRIKDEEIGFVGHSIAPVFMLHMLQKYNFKTAQAIFVAPFFNIPDAPAVWQFYPVNKTFYTYDFDFEKIKSHIGKSVVVHGDDDPYVPASEPPLFAERLGSEVYVVPGGRHCGSNFKKFHLLSEMIA